MPAIDPERLFSFPEAARLLGYTAKTLHNHRKQGRIHAHRPLQGHWRIQGAELLRLLEPVEARPIRVTSRAEWERRRRVSMERLAELGC